jgi:hypothetical protein
MIRGFLVCAVAAALSLLGLHKEFEEIAHDANGRVGVAVMLLESRESVELRGDERFVLGLDEAIVRRFWFIEQFSD